ncbi:DUF3024 domain-containing protein [Geothermobacter hydrogeniphilus]|nr:DUF3024 domain-containing protein [Geothermobacter hydrogeniphilus]
MHRSAEKLLDNYCRRRVARLGLEKPLVRLVWERLNDGYQLVEQSFDGRRLRQDAIARFIYQPELCQWTLHQQTQDHWQFCTNVSPNLNLQKLLDFVDADPFGQFWR